MPTDGRLSRSGQVEVGRDRPIDGVTPDPTVLSTVWEGPSPIEQAELTAGYPRSLDLEPAADRSRLMGWLMTPTTRRRALTITTIAALVCGGVVAAGEFDRSATPPTATAADVGADDSGSGDLTSQAVAADSPLDPGLSTGPDDVERESTDAGATRAPAARRAGSADEQLVLIAEPLLTAEGSWMLEAEVSDGAQPPAIVRFTVNGTVIEDLDRPPYRLLLGPDVRARLSTKDDRQPLVVTASALWSDDAAASSPATVILAD